MAKRGSKRRAASFLLIMAFGSLVLPARNWAQENTSPADTAQKNPPADSTDKSTQAPDTAASSDTGQTDPNSVQDYTSMLDDEAQTLAAAMPVQRLGRPGSLSHVDSPLHIGPIYDTYFSMFYVLGNGLVFDPTTNQFSTQIDNAGVFKTNLVYDLMVKRNRLAFQYSPELAIINGQLVQSLSNQDVSLAEVYLLSPRWSMSLGNEFSFHSGALISDDPTLQLDTETGQTSQNPFLQDSNRYLSDSTAATFRYVESERNTLSIRPSFEYQHAGFAGAPVSSYTTGVDAELNHALSETHAFGLFYREAYESYSRSLPPTLFTSFGGGFSYAFAPTWGLSLSGGAIEEASNGIRLWSYVGSASLYKTFRRSSVALQYYRGVETGLVLSDRVGSQVSLAYYVHPLRRLHLGATGSYENGNTSEAASGGVADGTYFTGEADWQLTSRVASFVTFGQRNEQGVSIDSASGHHFAFTAGIRWEAQRKTLY